MKNLRFLSVCIMVFTALMLNSCGDRGNAGSTSTVGTGGGAGTGGGGTTPAPGTVEWVESGGVLIIEAEDGTPESSDTWSVRTDVSDYRGSGFIRWMGSNFFNNKTHGIMAYTIKINNPGDYYLRFRAFHDPIAHGTTIDQENDCWTNFKLNSATDVYKTFRNGSKSGKPWSFDTKWEPSHGIFVDPIINLSAGVHTFRIAARSQNFMIDRIYLVKDTADLDANLPASTSFLVIVPSGIN